MAPSVQLLNFLKTWLKNHIPSSDMAFSGHLSRQAEISSRGT